MLEALDRVLARETATDILINGDAGMWVDYGAGLQREDSWIANASQVRDLGRELIALGGRHIDMATPCADVRLPNGVRAHVVLDSIARVGTLISLRIPRARPLTLDDFVTSSVLSPQQAAELAEAVATRQNILVTGGSGTGKTTLLGALLGEVPGSDRIITIEDIAEIQTNHAHVVGLEARQANAEGVGEITTQDLLRQALRMRADRLVLGECRGAELMVLLSALNTGHQGGGSTLHANSIGDVPIRLEALGHLAGLVPRALAAQAVTAFDVVIHLERFQGSRRLGAMGRLIRDELGLLKVTPWHE